VADQRDATRLHTRLRAQVVERHGVRGDLVAQALDVGGGAVRVGDPREEPRR